MNKWNVLVTYSISIQIKAIFFFDSEYQATDKTNTILGFQVSRFTSMSSWWTFIQNVDLCKQSVD